MSDVTNRIAEWVAVLFRPDGLLAFSFIFAAILAGGMITLTLGRRYEIKSKKSDSMGLTYRGIGPALRNAVLVFLLAFITPNCFLQLGDWNNSIGIVKDGRITKINRKIFVGVLAKHRTVFVPRTKSVSCPFVYRFSENAEAGQVTVTFGVFDQPEGATRWYQKLVVEFPHSDLYQTFRKRPLRQRRYAPEEFYVDRLISSILKVQSVYAPSSEDFRRNTAGIICNSLDAVGLEVTGLSFTYDVI